MSCKPIYSITCETCEKIITQEDVSSPDEWIRIRSDDFCLELEGEWYYVKIHGDYCCEKCFRDKFESELNKIFGKN